MFKIESYVTPILLSYVDKYVQNFKPADAQVSLWGGGVALHNLVLKADVLHQEVALPFTLVSGRIHELLIQVPWTKIMSEPIIVTIDTIECVLSLTPPASLDGGPPPAAQSRKTQVVEAPPGYMQALVRRIVSNIALRVHHLIVKYVQDDIVMSLNVKHLAVDSAGANWEPAFADIDASQPVIRRLVRLDDFTLCLDKSDSDGKIRFYQEPLLYRCQLDLRVLTRLVSATTRRATSLNVQLRSSRLAWSVTNDQLILLLRLLRERPVGASIPQSPAPKQTTSQPPINMSSVNSAEPARSESWSEWAWSWLPTWMDKEGGVEEAPTAPTPLPVFFSAYLDEVSLVFKVMEVEPNNRKRARGVLEVSAMYAAIKSSICSPTMFILRFGTRELSVRSRGKCVCGYLNYYSIKDESTLYLKKITETEHGTEAVEEWIWPEETISDKIEVAEAVDESFSESQENSGLPEGDPLQNMNSMDNSKLTTEEVSRDRKQHRNDSEELWTKMAPLLYIEYTHDRSPPQAFVNPYENPPKDFQYSDWVEECNVKIKLEPIQLNVCMGLIHRLNALRKIYKEQPLPSEPKQPMRTLTVEENEALSENLPQKRAHIEARGIRIRIIPWDHVPSERGLRPEVVFDFEVPKSTVSISSPMYPHRVCSAACQMPDDTGPLWLGARLNVSVILNAVQARICTVIGSDSLQRPCARADVRIVLHQLLNKEYFHRKEHVEFSYHLKIKELNICGSSARLQAAYEIPLSLYKECKSFKLKYTSLARDALHDEEAAAIDFALEDLTVRGFMTRNVNTHVITLQSAKSTALHEQKNTPMKQAWLFSAPDTPSASPFLRMAVQWCKEPVANSFDYLGMWTEPAAAAFDPLLVSWLAYKPALKPQEPTPVPLKNVTPSLTRRRSTPPSSSGRGASRTVSGAELVHVRSRSHGSSSEPSEKKERKVSHAQKIESGIWWSGEHLVALHQRLRSMLLNVDLGMVLVYVTMSSASALNCKSLQDAMEQHASNAHRVLALSLGRMTMHSSAATQQLWQDLRHDGPTFVTEKPDAESFPWKIIIAEVSCYTIEAGAPLVGAGFFGRPEKAPSSGGLKSNLKAPRSGCPKTVLELVTTSVTVSVVTKSIQYKTISRKETSASQSVIADKTKYFTSGMEFKPTSLKEFVRGPLGRGRKQSENTTTAQPQGNPMFPEEIKITDGPVVSLGVHLHADTPPVIIRLEHNQLHVVATAVHCLKHIVTLLKKQPPSPAPKQAFTSLDRGSHRSLIRSVSEIDEPPNPSDENESEQSVLVSIFDCTVLEQRPLKTFFWFQWVVSRASLVIASRSVKLAFDVDDIITTVDLQHQYNQLKIKLASASIRHYERIGSDDWTAGILGGRVLEAREATNSEEDSHFLSITITQAQISNLPASWKEELHPKLLEHKNSQDSMWEVYATLAPLEAIVQPEIMDNVHSLIKEMAPRSLCVLATEVDNRPPTWQWPFCYVSAGGIRVLLAGEEHRRNKNITDDTFIFTIEKVNVIPHPENPICRRAVNSISEGGWLATSGGYEGRQYEIFVKNVTIRSAQMKQLIAAEQESADHNKGTKAENPALRWSQRFKTPVITPILFSVDICCVIAPALYVGGILACGPAVEFNLVTDCSIELSMAQLALIRQLCTDFKSAETRPESTMGSTHDLGKHGVCPYATLLTNDELEYEPSSSEESLTEDINEIDKSQMEFGRSIAGDSGVETIASSSKSKITDDTLKKNVSVVFVEQTADASEYLEIFVTMGVLDIILYVADDNSPEVIALRSPRLEDSVSEIEEPLVMQHEMITKCEKPENVLLRKQSHSLTDTVRENDIGQTVLDIPTVSQQLRKFEGNVALIQFTLHQPNLYYWRKKTQKTLQLCLFNAWVALGVGPIPGLWHAVLFSTAMGARDPVTDIPPALATLKVIAYTGTSSTTCSTSSRGTVRLDIEKPVQIEVSIDRLRRLKNLYKLLQQNLLLPSDDFSETTPSEPVLYKMRNLLLQESMESVIIQTSQIGVCGTEGTMGWDSASLQLCAGARPERLNVRALVTALLVAAGPAGDRRHIVMQPLTFGAELEAYWEAWRRVEGGADAREPTVKIGIDFDRVLFDLRPYDLDACKRLMIAINELMKWNVQTPAGAPSSETIYRQSKAYAQATSLLTFERTMSHTSIKDDGSNDHFYKDDLRSGAFKILSGGQLPMAYQVMLHGNSVSWRYPHPRAITRIVAFPLPEQDQETDCVLELYTTLLESWEPHTYFKIPVGEPRELILSVPPPDTVFATVWRYRTCTTPEPNPPPFEFSINRFMPRSDPLLQDSLQEPLKSKSTGSVTAEQLSGVIRVDSYFAPILLPRAKCLIRVAHLQAHVHNSLPNLPNKSNYLEGYYVSKPLMRNHRVLSVTVRNTYAHAHVGSTAGLLFVLDTQLSGDILDCATGTIEQLINEFRVQAAVSSSKLLPIGTRTRVITSGIHVLLHVPRLRTLQALYNDWNEAYVQAQTQEPKATSTNEVEEETQEETPYKNKREIASATAVALEGRVSLWIHNSCASALRIGQEGTDEVVPLGPGARLAYRWRSPTATKRIRIALAGPTTDWQWSTSLPFVGGSNRVRLIDAESGSKDILGQEMYVYAKVEESGARRYMHLSGRLVLANMLRYPLLYKVRAHVPEASRWRTVCSGEMTAESVGRSVICGAEFEMVLKIKIGSQETGWSGDIPLKECPKENVPWLVKVPSEGDIQYMSVWCRVVRGRSDGRILATMWPLYVLHSHLPLDTDVLIVTEAAVNSTEDMTLQQLHPPPLLQSTPGRGASTHLRVPGTTSARHSLSFQYRNIECPVTREAVPLHYGVTDVSVFDKRAPVSKIDDVTIEILRWMDRSTRNASNGWPYSMVTKHWNGPWKAAVLQPRCDVTVRYQAVRAGGGCSLEIQLCPVALLCNATPIALTLRAHDAAPLCKLEAGSAISPPSAILLKPFFMSVELGRETFVSSQLQVSEEDPGQYGAPPPGHVALDHATEFSILCNQKVALLTLYYEIKEQINILGITSTYVLLNRLKTDLLVSPIAIPSDTEEENLIRPKTYKVVQPAKEGGIYGISLCRFWLRGRWRGGVPTELRTFLCLALPASTYPTRAPLPIRLGESPIRKAMSLVNAEGRSIPIVVSQIRHEHRWLVVVAEDPCPQFLVHNHTRLPIAVAQPLQYSDEPSTSQVEVAHECLGARWWCMVQPNTAIHYSTPAHCARYPPTTPPPVPSANTVPFLTFGKPREETDFEWSSPVAVADGEQLLQFYGGVTIKLRVRTHPHSTLLELQDVDQNDISASDIRRRLYGALSSAEYSGSQHKSSLRIREDSLERIGAVANLDISCGTEKVNDPTPRGYSVFAEKHSPDALSEIPTTILLPTEHSARRTTLSKASEKSPAPSIHRASELYLSQLSFKHRDTEMSVQYFDPASWVDSERLRCVISGIVVEMASSADVRPLLALHIDRTALLMRTECMKTKTILSIADAQIDNLQYESGQYDFAVVASTRAEALAVDKWPPLWNMFAEQETFSTKQESARLLFKLQQDQWEVVDYKYNELTEVEISLGTLALYVEDAYVKALVELSRLAVPANNNNDSSALSEERSLQAPLRLRLLHVHPLDLTLTLHTAVRMYIALDQSPLRLSAFKLHDMMTSAERLTHALTVHYLSAAILGAGWVVGGLELLGAPGALAARLGGATGGVRGVASAAAAALLRSLSAWAGSLARNLDLLAGDEEHARRAAAARRRPPPSFVAGLVTGITNFAINILGAVGGLAHHPLVGVAVGESESGATALRRGILGALTKPLSATADLVAYAGTGLLRQTGWDPVPEPRRPCGTLVARTTANWERDCVRWMFRLCELEALAGFGVLLDNAPLELLLTHKFLVVADPESERIVEMIDLRYCTLGPYQGQIIELCVSQKRQSKLPEARNAGDEDDEFQITAAAMARVARYTGAERNSSQATGQEMRVLSLLPPPGRSHELHAALAAALHHNTDTHFSML